MNLCDRCWLDLLRRERAERVPFVATLPEYAGRTYRVLGGVAVHGVAVGQAEGYTLYRDNGAMLLAKGGEVVTVRLSDFAPDGVYADMAAPFGLDVPEQAESEDARLAAGRREVDMGVGFRGTDR